MQYTLNAHKIFTGSPQKNDFLTGLELSAPEKKTLEDARTKTREALRTGIQAWNERFKPEQLFEQTLLKSLSSTPVILKPKFRTQGSYVYGTLNKPEHIPPQQIDIDDGMYIAMPFAGGRPVMSSAGYFLAVEQILDQTVCKDYKWKIHQKDACVRLQISERAHIDIPLYAVAQESYNNLLTEYASIKGAMDARVLDEGIELGFPLYRNMSVENMMLAHREKGWDKSHPKLMEEWFNHAIDTHGEVLRRVCRYLKGWRDYQWPSCELGSITLMACVVEIFDEDAHLRHERRDDAVLLEVAKALPQKLVGPIKNPVIPGKFLDEGWGQSERAEFHKRAKELHANVELAITKTYNRSIAIDKFQAAFGMRIPDDETLISVFSEVKILQTPAEIMPAPIVGKTASG